MNRTSGAPRRGDRAIARSFVAARQRQAAALLRRAERAEEERLRTYRQLFDEAPIAMLLEDWSGVQAMIDALAASGVRDLEAYLDEHPEFFHEARRTHVFLDANKATVDLFGARDKAHFLQLAPGLIPSKPESNIHVVRALARGGGFAQGERVLQSLDGRRVPILWQTHIPPGKPDRLLFLAIDVSALKLAEGALLAAQAELAHAGRVAVLGELAASITHEVNQPLGAIKLFADTALRWIDRPEPNLARARASIEKIARSAGQAADVIVKMRQFMRKSRPETVALDVREVLGDTLMLVEREAARQQVALSVDIDGDVPLAAGDRVQVQQVLVNLTMNALHALADPAWSERRVAIRVRGNSEGWVQFDIVDTGPGIAPDQLARIFEPFFSTRTEGLGLGLAICRSIVEAHGGSIVARNPDGGGAALTFTLPRALPATVAS